MCRHPLDGNKTRTRRRMFHGRTELALLQILNGTNVCAKHIIIIVHDAGLNQCLSALKRFLTRLENQLHRPFFHLSHHPGSRRKQHGRVTVMSAGVKYTSLTVNDKRQSIHIGTYHQRRPGLFAANVSDHTIGTAEMGVRFDTERFKFVDNVIVRFLSRHPKFGHFVQFIAECRDIKNLSHRKNPLPFAKHSSDKAETGKNRCVDRSASRNAISPKFDASPGRQPDRHQ